MLKNVIHSNISNPIWQIKCKSECRTNQPITFTFSFTALSKLEVHFQPHLSNLIPLRTLSTCSKNYTELVHVVINFRFGGQKWQITNYLRNCDIHKRLRFGVGRGIG